MTKQNRFSHSIAAVLISILFLWHCTPADKVERNAEPDEKGKNRSLQILDNGIIIVTAAINDVEGYFVFDTGAGVHLLTTSYYKDAFQADSLFDHWANYTGFRHNGERLDLKYREAGTLDMFPLREENAVITLRDGFDNNQIDGILGANLYADQAVSIDFKNQILFTPGKAELKSLAEKGQIITLILKRDERVNSLILFIPLQIDQETIAFVEFDTGTPFDNVVLHTRYANSLGLDTAVLASESNRTQFGGIEKIYYGKADTMRLSGYDQKLIRHDISFKSNMIHDGLIGAGFFRDRLLTIDIPNNRLIINMPRELAENL